MMDVRLGLEAADFERVHEWLSQSYWSPGISRSKVETAAKGSSLVINAYVNDVQVGYCRVISDRATFAWICDVIVDPQYRGRGVAQAMLTAALSDSGHQGLRRWVLATRDAQTLYAKFGFSPVQEPSRWMILRPKQ